MNFCLKMIPLFLERYRMKWCKTKSEGARTSMHVTVDEHLSEISRGHVHSYPGHDRGSLHVRLAAGRAGDSCMLSTTVF